jgi:hypothetical protein
MVLNAVNDCLQCNFCRQSFAVSLLEHGLVYEEDKKYLAQLWVSQRPASTCTLRHAVLLAA